MERTTEVVLFIMRRCRGEVLILRRRPALGGFWHPVAGGVEPGECPIDAARREAREEAGLVLSRNELRYSASACFVYHVGADRTVDCLGVVRAPKVRVECFLADVHDAFEPELNGEHEAYAWCTVERAVDMLYWNNVRGALRELAYPAVSIAV